MRAGGGVELGNGQAQRDAVGVARVHAAEEGFHEAVDDLAAETRRHVLADGDVLAHLGAGQVGVPLDAAQALFGEDVRDGGGAAGDTHDVALGHGAQGAAGPQGGRRGGGRLEVVAQSRLAGEVHGLRAARQHRLGTEVDACARDLAYQQLAAQAVGGLQDGDPRAPPEQAVGGCQPRDPSADHHDVSRTRRSVLFAHGSTFSDTTDASRRGARCPARVRTVTASGPESSNVPGRCGVEEASVVTTLGVDRMLTRSSGRPDRSVSPVLSVSPASPASPGRTARPARVLAGMFLVTALALSGCGAADDASTSSDKGYAQDAGDAKAGPAERADSGAAGSGSSGGRKAAPPKVTVNRIIRTASLTVEVKEVAKALDDARATAENAERLRRQRDHHP